MKLQHMRLAALSAVSLCGAGTALPSLAAEPQIVSAYVSAALKTDGSVWAWGDACRTTYAQQLKDNNGVPLTGIKSLATNGYYGLLLIQNDGTLLRSSNCGAPWERVLQSDGTPVSNVVQASGAGSTAFVRSDGTVWNFGSNAYGQLGTGSAGGSAAVPVQVRTSGSSFLTGVRTVRVNELFSVALKDDGSVWVWGYSWRTPGNYYAVPLKDKAGVAVTNVRSLGSGGQTVFHLIKNDGTLWSVDNRTGEVSAVLAPDKTGLTQAHTVDGTYMYGCSAGVATKTDGSVWQWGCTSTSYSSYPAFAVKTATGTLTDVRSVAGTNYNVLALRHDSSVWQWGTGGAGMSTPVGGFVATPVVDATGKPLALVVNANSCSNTP